MTSARRAMPTLLGWLVALSCAESRGREQLAPTPAGAAGESNASNAGDGAGGALVNGEGGAAFNANAGESSAGGVAEPGAMTLSVFNVALRRPVAGHDPTLGQLQAVELPAWITLMANVPEGTRSVAFQIDQSRRVDGFPPFLLHEDDFGRGRWQAIAGEHLVTAKAYSEAGAQGSLLATLEQNISYHQTGLAPDFAPLGETDNALWVQQNLDQVMQPRTLVGTLGDELPYRLFVPPEYDAAVKYPLLVFLHDRAARGTDNGPASYASSLFTGKNSLVSPNLRHEFPAIIVVPQCPAEPADEQWARWYGSTAQDPEAGLVFENGYYPSHDEPSITASLLRELVDEVSQELSVDPTRLYITGESMGGTGVWDITWRWPELWAAAVPIAGLTDPSRAPLLLDLPFWVFHSTLDTEDNVIGSLTMVDKLKLLGGIVYYTQYQDVDHGQTPDRVWGSEPELLPWIWGHQLSIVE